MKNFLCAVLTTILLLGNTISVLADMPEVTEQNKQLGLNTRYTHWTDNYSDDALISESGTNAIRNTVDWNTVENVKGTYSWSKHDDWLNRYKDNKNIDITLMLAGMNKNYNTPGTVYFSSQEEIDGFTEFAVRVVKRYPFIKAIEIWNEPNLGFTSISTDNAAAGNKDKIIENYVKMANSVAQAVREANPDVEIIVGAVAETDRVNAISHTDFINGVLPKVYKNIDAISVHAYRAYGNAEEFNTVGKTLRDLVRPYGGWIKLYMTETGWFTGSAGGAKNETIQAEEIVKVMPILDEAGYDGAFLFEYKNKGNDLTDHEQNWGLLNSDRTKKQSFDKYAEFMEKVGDGKYIGMIEENGTKKYMYATEGGAVIVKWSDEDDVPVYEENISDNDKKNLVQTIIVKEISNLKTDFSDYCNGLSITAENIIGSEDCYNLIQDIYDFGVNVINSNSDEKNISEFLYELYRLTEKVSAAGLIFNDFTQIVKAEEYSALVDDYAVFEKAVKASTIGVSDYSKKMLEFGKEKLYNVFETEFEYKITDGIGTIECDEMLKLSGTAGANELIAIKVIKDNTEVYLDTFKANKYGEYEISVPLKNGIGEYNVSIQPQYLEEFNLRVNKTAMTTGNRQTQKSAFAYIQAKNILRYAELLTLKKQNEDIKADVKWKADTKNVCADVVIANNTNNIKDFYVFLTGYDENKVLVSCYMMELNVKNNDLGAAALKIPNLDNTNKCVYVWDKDMSPVGGPWNY